MWPRLKEESCVQLIAISFPHCSYSLSRYISVNPSSLSFQILSSTQLQTANSPDRPYHSSSIAQNLTIPFRIPGHTSRFYTTELILNAVYLFPCKRVGDGHSTHTRSLYHRIQLATNGVNISINGIRSIT